ncbi:MAG: apolipoprotein N-acyltransferase [Planctomycetes bacterium]|nr:apolipoprotein N-acyltransferase [Planctomycetota bacterium]
MRRPATAGSGSPAPDSAAPAALPRWLWTLPLASIFLLWFSFHPVDQGWLAYVALAPWFFFLIVETRVRRACGMTFWMWWGFFSLGMNWLRYTSGLGLFAIAAILGLEMFMFAWVARRWLSRRNDAVGWVGLGAMFIGWEYLRIYLMGGFPWFMIGHSQHAYLPLVQCADIGGVPLVGLPAALSSALLAGLAARRFAGKPVGRDLAVAFAGLAALLVAMTSYGMWRLKTIQNVPALHVGLVQGNVPQDIKDLTRFEGYDPRITLKLHRVLSEQVAPQSDLIVWAETMFPYAVTPKYPENEEALHRTAAHLDRAMLIGTIVQDADGREYNSALLVDPQGKTTGRYDKRHLVLVAEYMPFKTIAPWLIRLIEKIVTLKGFGSLEQGDRLDLMEVKGKKFGALICFDSMWPDEARSYAEQGGDFLVTISNDGWFKESEQLDQILCVNAFRCVENRMGMARCTNTGISAFIGADGRITEFEVDGKVKSVKGATVGMVQGRAAHTIFTSCGDWVGKCCLLLAGLLGLWGPRRRPTGGPGAVESGGAQLEIPK